jgi:hypothetical protein
VYFDGSGTISALFRRPGTSCPLWSGDGVITVDEDAPPVQHKLTITARDFDGNVSTRSLDVVLGSRPYFTSCGFEKSTGAIRVEGEYAAGPVEFLELSSRSAESGWRPVRQYPVEGSDCSMSIEPPGQQSEWRLVLVGANGARSMPAVLRLSQQPAPEDRATRLNVRTRLLYDKIVVQIKSDRPCSTVPLLEVTGNGRTVSAACMVPDGENAWIGTIPFRTSGANDIRVAVSAFDAWGDAICGEDSISCHWFDEFKNNSITSEDGMMTVFAKRGSLYRNAPVYLTAGKPGGSSALRPLTGSYTMVFGDDRIKSPFLAQITVGEEIPEHAAVFYQSGSRWIFLSRKKSGQVMTANLSAQSTIAVFVDTAPPAISPKSPANGAVLTNPKPAISVAVSDAGSGLGGSDSVRMSLDGSPIYGEFNTRTGVVTFKPVYAIEPGRHTVDVKVTDLCGNATSRSWTFTISGPVVEKPTP